MAHNIGADFGGSYAELKRFVVAMLFTSKFDKIELINSHSLLVTYGEENPIFSDDLFISMIRGTLLDWADYTVTEVMVDMSGHYFLKSNNSTAKRIEIVTPADFGSYSWNPNMFGKKIIPY